MKFKTTYDVSGTSLCGYIEIDYQNLVNVLGSPRTGPNEYSGDGKVTCSWAVEFTDGTVATIYDYKTYSGTPMEMYEWHIGGYNKTAACKHIQKLFPNFNAKTAY